MIAPGEIVRDVRGRSYRVTREIGSGGQGTAFEVADVATGRNYVAKVYHPAYATPEAASRLDAIVACDLPNVSPALCASVSRLRPCHGLGAVQPKVEGVPLEEVFANPNYGLLEGLAIAAAVCKALAALEARGIAHGDVSATNVMARREGNAWYVVLIDLDNCVVPNAPAPCFIGQQAYAAPELLLGAAGASIESDRFALAVLLYEILLRRHPWAFAGPQSFNDYCAMLATASWAEDPADGTRPAPEDGWPVAILSRRLQALFRAALQTDPAKRPAASEWARELERSLASVYECSGCGQHQVNEPTSFACVACGRPPETLELRIAGRAIAFERPHTVVGRADVNGGTAVSRRHAVFTRSGFGLRVRNLSLNGLTVLSNGTTTQLAEGQETDVHEGDVLVFAPGLAGTLVEQ